MSWKILISALSILLSVIMVSAATWAYFNETNVSSANTFSSISLK